MRRIAVVVNKDFEYAGFVEGLRDVVPVFAGTNGRDAECRFDRLVADVYCVQNLFREGENSSNSELKHGYLKRLFGSNAFRLDECDGVLSFSTSESTPDVQGDAKTDSRNGCVYVGNRFFLCDGRLNDPSTQSHLALDGAERYVEEPLCGRLYDFLNLTDMELRRPPINSASKLKCTAGDFSCVCVVNVMDYSRYKAADEDAYGRFRDRLPVGIETTHGVVAKAFKEACKEIGKDVPVNFVSPIVDRYLKFDEDVDGKYGRQNYVCSYNGGVATGHMLEILNDNWHGNRN